MLCVRYFSVFILQIPLVSQYGLQADRGRSQREYKKHELGDGGDQADRSRRQHAQQADDHHAGTDKAAESSPVLHLFQG